MKRIFTTMFLIALLLTACGAPANGETVTPETPIATATLVTPAAPTRAPEPTDTPTLTLTPTPIYEAVAGSRDDAEKILGMNWKEVDDWETWGIKASAGEVIYGTHEQCLIVITKTDKTRLEIYGPGMTFNLPTSGTYRIYWCEGDGLKSPEDLLKGIGAVARELEVPNDGVTVAAMTLEGPLVIGTVPSWVTWKLDEVTSLDPRVPREQLHTKTVLPASYAVAAEWLICNDGTTVTWVHTDAQDAHDVCGGGMHSRNGIYFTDATVPDANAFINANAFFLMKTAEGFALEPSVRVWSFDVTIGNWLAFDEALFVAPATPVPSPTQ